LVRVKQFSQDSAENGNIIQYDGSAGIWMPKEENVSSPTYLDNNLSPNDTIGDGYDTGLIISNTPQGWVAVKINGILYEIGDGVSTKDGYFSDGVTIRNIDDIVAGDSFYWNGTIAGFDLDTDDVINFNYDLPSDGTTMGNLVFIEKQIVDTPVQTISFDNLDGNIDKIYYLIGRISTPAANTQINFWLNNKPTPQVSQRIRVTPALTLRVNADGSKWYWGVLASSNTEEFCFELYIHVNTSNESVSMDVFGYGRGNFYIPAFGGANEGSYLHGEWTSSSNITSIQVTSSTTDLEHGTEVSLFKLNSS
jgi:hypothetical protein